MPRNVSRKERPMPPPAPVISTRCIMAASFKLSVKDRNVVESGEANNCFEEPKSGFAPPLNCNRFARGGLLQSGEASATQHRVAAPRTKRCRKKTAFCGSNAGFLRTMPQDAEFLRIPLPKARLT